MRLLRDGVGWALTCGVVVCALCLCGEVSAGGGGGPPPTPSSPFDCTGDDVDLWEDDGFDNAKGWLDFCKAEAVEFGVNAIDNCIWFGTFFGYTFGCGACFQNLVACHLYTCSTVCAASSFTSPSTACSQCMESTCMSDFEGCTGFDLYLCPGCTYSPTAVPSTTPSSSPTGHPTSTPSGAPTSSPSAAPTSSPSLAPSQSPQDLTQAPSAAPGPGDPLSTPTAAPTLDGDVGTGANEANKDDGQTQNIAPVLGGAVGAAFLLGVAGTVMLKKRRDGPLAKAFVVESFDGDTQEDLGDSIDAAEAIDIQDPDSEEYSSAAMATVVVQPDVHITKLVDHDQDDDSEDDDAASL